MAVSYVRLLDTVGRDDVAIAGGKGANLGELIRAGLPVPTGFVLTTEAYRAFVDSNALSEQLLELVAQRRPEEAADQIGALFAAGTIPDRLREEVTEAYQALDRPPVAVRSSATAEDLADASFAGQQDTYLNVRGDGRAAGRGAALLGVAVDRPGHGLPGAPGHRPGDGQPRGGRPGDGRR